MINWYNFAGLLLPSALILSTSLRNALSLTAHATSRQCFLIANSESYTKQTEDTMSHLSEALLHPE